MVLTPTTQISLGYSASDFSLFNPLINDFQSLKRAKIYIKNSEFENAQVIFKNFI